MTAGSGGRRRTLSSRPARRRGRSALPTSTVEGASSAAEGGEQASARHPRKARSERCCGVMLEDHGRGCPEKTGRQRDPPVEQQKGPAIPSAQPVIHGIIIAPSDPPRFKIVRPFGRGRGVLTQVLTTGLDDLGRTWSRRRPGPPLSRAGCQLWMPVDDPRLTRNA